MKNFSEYDANEVGNSPTSSKTFGRSNVFYMNLINETAFEITVGSTTAGEVRIPAGKIREFKGHPDFPFEVALTIRFNPGAAPTDFLTILTIATNGSRLKQC